jgi:hypothetical protein
MVVPAKGERKNTTRNIFFVVQGARQEYYVEDGNLYEVSCPD